ncbi:hypothetical protein ABIC65_001586 [Sphingomonas trueperi]|jgi:hypothetical protein
MQFRLRAIAPVSTAMAVLALAQPAAHAAIAPDSDKAATPSELPPKMRS